LKVFHLLSPVLCALAAVALAFACARPRERSLAITNVTVIDVAGGAARAGQTVVVAGERILAVGDTAALSLPRGTKIVDGAGRFLIPGLVDMHVHLTAAGEPDGSRRFMIPLLLANGITTVRDMGGYLESLVPLREEIKKRKRLGPQIFFAGPYLDGSPPSFEPSLVVTDRVQASEDVHQLVERGVDFIKVQSMLGRDAYFAIAEAARREKIPFVGHVPDQVTAAQAADAGQYSIEHLTNMLRGCSSDEARLMREQFHVPSRKETAAEAHERVVRWQRALLESYSATAADALVRKFAEKSVWQTPTLVLLKHDAFPTPGVRRAEAERYVPKATRQVWEKGRERQMRFVTPAESDLRAQLLKKSESLVIEMQKSGVHILAGTDSPAPGVVPGDSLHQELALLVEAGLEPKEALRAATSAPAEFLGKSKDAGTVAAGKYADLVLLDSNPLEEIGNTRRIRAVMVRGQMLERGDLDQMLAEELGFASAP
jgi:imidazolonepropionase-like amidohydrolase